ncbi:unnamed protein product [Orchesella dallaii]|uniref:FAD/NAD(P)-binding domain-containing protein n=1 Tax=Orchesella dallaii TaxID=48710 RepID=A0ABP1QQB3_9HEXA
MLSSLHRIVVVGGGAGGLELITHLGRTLGRKRIAQPVLVDGSQTHIWKPLLHEVATGSLNTGEDELNYFSHGHRTGYEFQFGWMQGLDKSRKVIKIGPIKDFDGRQVAPERELRYDSLVIAVGGLTNAFGTPGVSEHCVCLDTPADAEYLRKRILGQALSVVMGSSPVPKLRIGIVGGGATGIELAGEIHHTICELRTYGANLFQEQLQITIMEGGPRILGGSPQSLSKFAMSELKKRNINVMTDCMIKSVNEKGFILQDGSLLEKDIKIWTAGIKAPDWLKELGLQVNKFNRIKVNENLQSVDDPFVYALGDCACAPLAGDSTKCLPATAQVAHQQAEWLTKKLEARLTNKPCKPFLYKPQGMLVSLGESTAVGSLAAIVGPKRDYYVEGRGAKALYSSLYRMHQAVLYGWTRAILLWIGDKLRHVALPQLKLH